MTHSCWWHHKQLAIAGQRCACISELPLSYGALFSLWFVLRHHSGIALSLLLLAGCGLFYRHQYRPAYKGEPLYHQVLSDLEVDEWTSMCHLESKMAVDRKHWTRWKCLYTKHTTPHKCRCNEVFKVEHAPRCGLLVMLNSAIWHSLDAEMKCLQSVGLGTKRSKWRCFWEGWGFDGKGAAGEKKKPQMLLDTMVFYNGLYFALRSSREHSQLGVCLAWLRSLRSLARNHTFCTERTTQRSTQVD